LFKILAFAILHFLFILYRHITVDILTVFPVFFTTDLRKIYLSPAKKQYKRSLERFKGVFENYSYLFFLFTYNISGYYKSTYFYKPRYILYFLNNP